MRGKYAGGGYHRYLNDHELDEWYSRIEEIYSVRLAEAKGIKYVKPIRRTCGIDMPHRFSDSHTSAVRRHCVFCGLVQIRGKARKGSRWRNRDNSESRAA